MKSAAKVQEETASLLGEAVAKVTQLAINPELAPFQKALKKLTDDLEEKLGELEELVEGEKEQIQSLERRLGAAALTSDEQLTVLKEAARGSRELKAAVNSLTAELSAVATGQAELLSRLEVLGADIRKSAEAAKQQNVLAETSLVKGKKLLEGFENSTSDTRRKLDELTTSLLAARKEAIASAKSASEQRQDARQLIEELRSELKGEQERLREDTQQGVERLQARIEKSQQATDAQLFEQDSLITLVGSRAKFMLAMAVVNFLMLSGGLMVLLF